MPARPNRRLRHAAGTLVVVLLACAALAAQAHAATFTAATGDGSTTACPNPASGTCTLRQLILYENQNAPNPPDTISLPAGFYFLTNQALTITRSVAIVGAGARTTTIDQGSSTPDRVFDVQVPNGGSAPTVSISGLTIEGGTANSNNGFFGGNVRNAGANLTLNDDWITNGTTSFGSGAGVSNDAGTLIVQRSLISNNNGGNDSGAIQTVGETGRVASLTVTDSTITNNSSQQGGGIFSWCNGSPCPSQGNTTTVINSTIVHNDGGPRNAGGGGLLASYGRISVQGSIIAFNTVSTPGAGTPSNCGGSGISSGGYNIDSGADCGFTSPTDHQNTDPKLTSTSTENWGGNTDTFSLDARSPAVDAIPKGAANCGGTDQRLTGRPQGQGCDIGAFELLQPAAGQQTQIQVLADPCGIFGRGTINWGDGSPPSQSDPGTFVGTHTFTKSGRYDGTVTYSNDCSTSPKTVGFDLKVQAGIVANPLASASTPSVTNSNATFIGQVNPRGGFTNAHWEYGLDPTDRGAGFSGNVFDQTTSPQGFEGDYTDHPFSATVANLLPNAHYHVRLVAANSAGTTFGPDQTFTTPKAPPPPPPVLGKENFTPNGTVFILQNGEFVKLTQTLQLPSGTLVNALRGSVSLVAAGVGSGAAHDAATKKKRRKPKHFSGTFGGAVFRVTQAKSGPSRGLTTLSVVEDAFKGGPTYASCKARAAADAHAALSRRILQTLHARATGRFRTRGRYAAGTVRGTAWTTSDRCDGTLIAVQQHSVLVSDLVKHIAILVRSGHHYLAKAPALRKRK